MDNWTIRPMAAGDVDAVRSIVIDSNRIGGVGYYTADEIAAFGRTIQAAYLDDLPDRAHAHVACDINGDIVANAGWVWFDDGEARLTMVFVHPDWFGRGVGSRLVDRVETHARSAGATGLVVRSSLNAVSFYERLGYTAIRPMPTEVDVGTIGSTLMRRLPPPG